MYCRGMFGAAYPHENLARNGEPKTARVQIMPSDSKCLVLAHVIWSSTLSLQAEAEIYESTSCTHPVERIFNVPSRVGNLNILLILRRIAQQGHMSLKRSTND
jgi:hypothetical protein